MAKTVKVVLSVLALGAILAHLVLDVNVDNITVALLLIAALPWLGEIFQSLELPGGWKVSFHDLQKVVGDLETTTEETAAKAMSAQAQASMAQNQAESAQGLAAGAAIRADFAVASEQSLTRIGLSEDLFALADEYDALRRDLPSGDLRSNQMHQVFFRMTRRSVTGEYPWETEIASHSGGRRLASYAYVRSHPMADAVQPLFSSLMTVTARSTRQPFGEFWGLATLSELMSLLEEGERAEMLARLPELQLRFRRGTDRYSEVARMLGRDTA